MTRSTKRKIKKALLWFEVTFILLFAAAVGVIGGAFWEVHKLMPPDTLLADYQPVVGTEIYSDDNKLLAKLSVENRDPIPLAKVGKNLQNAVIALEDSRFYEHQGLDFRGVARALWRNVREGETGQGGSTITQQLARSIYLNSRKTVRRKLLEALLAIELERKFTKEQILELYMNQIYFGSGAYGVQAASKIYFGKHAKDLTVPEAAMIAGIPRHPSRYSPYIDREGKYRRDIVLARMAELGMIKPEEKQKYIDGHIKLAYAHPPRSKLYHRAPYFVSYVVDELRERYGDDMIYKGGLRVRTTLNMKMQEAAERAMEEGVAGNQWRRISEGALVTIDPTSGYVRAMVGGVQKPWEKYQFNCAVQARRQPGSAFKLFVYAAWLDAGRGVYDRVGVSVRPIKQADGTWWSPGNHGRWRGGSTTALNAFAWSVNGSAVNALLDVGADTVIDYARRLGIKSPMRAAPSLALGTSEVTVLEMASAYGVFANDGVLADPMSIIRVTDRDGQPYEENQPRPRRVSIGEDTITAMNALTEAVAEWGTASSAGRWVRGAHGKTGTTENYKDAWFVGYTRELVTAVWMGNRNGKQMRSAYGGDVCAPIWGKYMARALRLNPNRNRNEALQLASADTNSGPESEEKPRRRRQVVEDAEDYLGEDKLIRVRICTESGLRSGRYCPHTARRRFVSGQQPRERCDLHTRSVEGRSQRRRRDRSSEENRADRTVSDSEAPATEESTSQDAGGQTSSESPATSNDSGSEGQASSTTEE